MAGDRAPDAAGAREPSAWRRFLARARAVEAAMNDSYDDIQDRRLLALEREVARLRGLVEAGRAGGRFGADADA